MPKVFLQFGARLCYIHLIYIEQNLKHEQAGEERKRLPQSFVLWWTGHVHHCHQVHDGEERGERLTTEKGSNVVVFLNVCELGTMLCFNF